MSDKPRIGDTIMPAEKARRLIRELEAITRQSSLMGGRRRVTRIDDDDLWMAEQGRHLRGRGAA